MSRLVFWIWKELVVLPFFCVLGNFAVAVAQYSRKSFFCRPERAKRVRS